jgi:electron transfer flavoprotein alpha subunit
MNPASCEVVAGAQQTGLPVSVVVPGADVSAALSTLSGADIREGIALEGTSLESYVPDAFVDALAAFVADEGPTWVMSAHTYQARDLMPALAGRLRRGLATDCTAMRLVEDELVFSRPMFGGKLSAEVSIEGPAPWLATFQLGSIGQDVRRRAGPPFEIRRVPATVADTGVRQRVEPRFREEQPTVDLTRASRIVAVGRGVKEREQLKVVEALASALGAELAASRPICDAGWLPMDRQVGSSGQTVAPRLYVAVGISGAIQHIVGMRGAATIVAINKDPQAPIFEVADYGIVGDLFEVVPAIVRALG